MRLAAGWRMTAVALQHTDLSNMWVFIFTKFVIKKINIKICKHTKIIHREWDECRRKKSLQIRNLECKRISFGANAYEEWIEKPIRFRCNHKYSMCQESILIAVHDASLMLSHQKQKIHCRILAHGHQPAACCILCIIPNADAIGYYYRQTLERLSINKHSLSLDLSRSLCRPAFIIYFHYNNRLWCPFILMHGMELSISVHWWGEKRVSRTRTFNINACEYRRNMRCHADARAASV